MLHMSTDTFILNAIILREKILKKYNKLINCWFFKSLFLNYKKMIFLFLNLIKWVVLYFLFSILFDMVTTGHMWLFKQNFKITKT